MAFLNKRTRRCQGKYTNEPRLKAYRKLVAAQARVCADRPPQPIDGAAYVEIWFQHKRPKNQYYARKSGLVLREDAPKWVTNSQLGDLDKLTRAVFDAMTAAKWWLDDSLAAELHVYHWYGEHHGLCVRMGLAS